MENKRTPINREIRRMKQKDRGKMRRIEGVEKIEK
jgi:hypothetical protein